MTSVLPHPAPPTRKLLLAIAATAFSAVGTLSLLQGLSLIDARWLGPNPDVPRPLFMLTGAVMLLASILIGGRLAALHSRAINAVGYSVFGLSLLLAHWLLFLSKGGRCVLSAWGGTMLMSHMLCAGLFGTILVLTDLTVILVALAKFAPRRAG